MKKSNETKSQTRLIACDSNIIFDVLVILMLLFSLIYGYISSNKNVDSNSVVVKTLSYLCAPLSVIVAISLLSVRKRYNVFIELTCEKEDKITLLATLLITVGMIFGLSELNGKFVEFLNLLGLKSKEIVLPKKSTLSVIMVIVFVCILPSICEEMFFRGIIIKSLKSTGEVFAIILSGLMFSLFHMSAQQTIYQFIVGALYAFIVLRGGSWVLTTISHFINNFFIIINYYFLSFYPTGILKYLLIVIGLISLLAGVYLLYKNKKEIKVLESKKDAFLGIPIGIIACVIMWVAGLVLA